MANVGLQNWRASIDERVQGINISTEEPPWKTYTIYKVPAYLRKLNPEAFTPELVSFGPYHHADKKLQLMEVRKERALVQFLQRVKQPLGNIIEEVRGSVEKLRGAYSCLDEMWKTDEDAFVKLMILDGCFLYEILFSFAEGYSNMDPFFQLNSHQRSIIIKHDMLLIENQLPMTLMKTLDSFQSPQIQILPENAEQILHLLDLNLKSDFATAPEEEMNTNSSSVTSNVRCSAVELHEAGVRFKKSNTTNLGDVHFNLQNGTFHLPQLKVDDSTERIFLNKMAFEQLHPNIHRNFVSYVFLMDEIIDTANDVRLLRQSDIINNLLGSDEEVALLFNRVTENVLFDANRNSMMQVRKDVSIFCGKRRNKWRASLNHTYFKSPWSVISLVGAALVILLTIIQTICAIIQL